MLLFLLFLFSLKEYRAKDLVSCKGVLFDHVYFDIEMLLENLDRPYNLIVHKYSNTLFFSHTVHNGSEVDFEIMTYDMAKKSVQRVDGIPGGYAITYDPGNDDIFFGGHDGIYKYNFLNRTAEFFAEENKSIWGLFIRKNFYYIEYPTQKLYVLVNDKFVQVAEAMKIEIDNFFVSKISEIYFANKTALYKVDKTSKNAIVLSDEVTVRQIVEDSFGDVYFCGNGIYVENKPYHNVKKVAEIDAFGMAFDENDYVIYSDRNSIKRLVPSKNSAICIDSLSLS